MTPQQGVAWINGGWQSSRFAKTIAGVGKGIDVDGLYGFQCKDFANGYADYMGVSFTAGNAIVLWTLSQPGWDKVASPQPGDVFVRNYVSGGINYGDTGVVNQVIDSTVQVIQQNTAGNLNVGSPPKAAVYLQSIMLGYLRLRSSGMTGVSENLLANYFQFLLGREPDLPSKKFIGQPADVVFDAIVNSAEYKARQQGLGGEAQKKLDEVKAILG